MASIDLLYGTMLIGVFSNCILFGIMIMQMFIYYQTYTKDNAWIRWFVLYLLVAEVTNTCCDIYLIYQPLIQEFGTLTAVTYFPKMLAASPIVTVCVSTPVQIFTAWRIKVVSRRKAIAVIICLLAIISFVGGIWVGVQVVTFKLFSRKLSFMFNLPGVIWFVSAALADILITVTLVTTLSRRQTRHAPTTLSINRIIRLTIQTGLVTTMFALADLLFFTISPKTAMWVGEPFFTKRTLNNWYSNGIHPIRSFVWDFSISKLYTNAFLSTLNARAGWGNLNRVEDHQGSVLFSDDSMGFATHPLKTIHGSNGAQNTTTGASSGTALDSHGLPPLKFNGSLCHC